jgi:AhpD family alkylhydroperoxidase
MSDATPPGRSSSTAIDPDHWLEQPVPRIPPAPTRDIHPVLRPLIWVAGRAVGGPPPNIFTTLARHGKLFVPWLVFAGRLMPGGTLPRIDTELVILRVAYLTRCRYEWDHHVRIGGEAGLRPVDIERIAEGPSASGWTGRQAAILQAVEELHDDRVIADGTWARVSEHLSHKELIELCMLTGHYEMLAGTLLSAGVQPEKPL